MTNKSAVDIVEDLIRRATKKESAVQSPSIVKKALPKVVAAPIPEKRYYDVKVECMLPAVLTYRVLAETPEQAAILSKGMSPVGVKHKLAGKKELKLSVYEAGSSMLKYVKNLVGG
jgi:hypothetical protein